MFGVIYQKLDNSIDHNNCILLTAALFFNKDSIPYFLYLQCHICQIPENTVQIVTHYISNIAFSEYVLAYHKGQILAFIRFIMTVKMSNYLQFKNRQTLAG